MASPADAYVMMLVATTILSMTAASRDTDGTAP